MKPAIRTLVIAMALCLASGCATVDKAQYADDFTTVAGIEVWGLQEGNPIFGDLSWPGIIAVKFAVTQGMKFTPPEVCQPGLLGLTAVGFGAFFLNAATIITGAPWAGIPFILLMGIKDWEDWQADAIATCADPWASFPRLRANSTP